MYWKTTLDDLGGCISPASGYFTKQISSTYKGQMENGFWERLSKNLATWQQDISRQILPTHPCYYIPPLTIRHWRL